MAKNTANLFCCCTLSLLLLAQTTLANEFCGDQGLWLQVLGSGGSDLAQGRRGAAYLVWVDNRAKVLIDAGAGSAAHFVGSGAKFQDLDAVLLSNTHPDTWVDLPVLLRRSYYGQRKTTLPVLAPAANDQVVDLRTALAAWAKLDTRTVYPAELLASLRPPVQLHADFRIELREVISTGGAIRNDFRNEQLSIRSMPVDFGQIPAVAWHLSVQDLIIVLIGNASGRSGQLAALAQSSDMLVMHLNIEESRRGLLRQVAMTPSEIGRTAAEARTRVLLLGHRMGRTVGLESIILKQIEARYQGAVRLADDNECYGLEPK